MILTPFRNILLYMSGMIPETKPSRGSNSSTASSVLKTLWTNDTGLVVALTLLCLISRLYAMPASLLEWDDLLFARALHHFDIAAHNPHPPGFPVFVMLARAAFLLLHDENLALIAVNLLINSFLAAALFYLYREIFQDRTVALAGALICMFAPNVWIYSVAPRSDGVGFTLGIIGLTLVIRGLHSRRSLLVGCALLGLGMGVRVTVLPVVAPVLTVVLFAWLRLRQWRIAASAVLLTVACILVWYIPLILHTTWQIYRSVTQQHRQYILETDTILASSGMMLHRFERFFVVIWGAPWIMRVIYILSALGLLTLVLKRRWQALGWLMVSFVPYMIFTFLLNAPVAGVLYSLPYVPLFTGLTAYALVTTPSSIYRSAEWKLRQPIGLSLASLLVVAMIVWTHPVINMLRSEESPPLRAVRYIAQNADPASDTIRYEGLFMPHVSHLLPNFRKLSRMGEVMPGLNLIAPSGGNGRSYNLTEMPVLGAKNDGFHWASEVGAERFRGVSLGRYFDAYVTKTPDLERVVFSDGWHQQEQANEASWRWMSRRGQVALFSDAETMLLRLRGVIPSVIESSNLPLITLKLDGKELDRFTPQAHEFDRTMTVKPDSRNLWSRLTIESDQVVIPSRFGASSDNRELSFQCLSLDWTAQGQTTTFSPDQFIGQGWHVLEKDVDRHHRWTSDRAITHLPPIKGDAQIAATMHVFTQENGVRPIITLKIGDHVLDRFDPPIGYFTKIYPVPNSLHQSSSTDFEIAASSTFKAPPDTRSLAAKVFNISWAPAGKD